VQALVRELLGGSQAHATSVVAYGNSRMPSYSGLHAELFEARQTPMQVLASEEHKDRLKGFDSLFIHVGTQRGKVGLENQIKLEYDDTLAVARACLEGGCKTCHIVSSVGASPTAGVVYLKTKGRIEEALKTVGFERLVIYRPAALVGGDRDVPGAKRFFITCLSALNAISKIDVKDVATTMRVVALRPGAGAVEVFENAELLALAK
jgi:uncharacterized protein YbjT (DUF2867 family)